ncbi:optineurin-like isoform X3 [Portunus trituberculatus]|uniref:optineurin-like isoform X3 n=1 Tax=Portunus trituberculatus TaxID=210409 RepID=UPI001E1CCB30|nr:optineurin-like isoform X3 [Portunus trituberculatus]
MDCVRSTPTLHTRGFDTWVCGRTGSLHCAADLNLIILCCLWLQMAQYSVQGVMVRQDEPMMGQGGMCGVTTPSIESLPHMPQPPVGGSANGVAVEMQESLSSLMAGEESVNQEELLSRFRTIINENLLLKETIAQNNLAMRQQLGLFVKWKHQNEQQHQDQRHRVTELSQQVASVQQENATLRAQLACTQLPEEAQPHFKELDNTIILLNKRLEVAERNLRQAQEDKEKLMAQRSRLEGDITLLKCDITTSRSEQERLQLERFELLSTANELRQQLRQSREGASIIARVTESSPVTESTSLLSPADVQKLRDQLRKEQDISATLLQELHDTRNQVEGLERDVQRAHEAANTQRELCRKLQSQITTAAPVPDTLSKDPIDALEKKRLKDEAAMLREEVDTLETALEAERQKNSEERSSVVRAHGEVNRLKKEIQDLKEQTERDKHNDQYYEVKIKSISEKHDEATAKLMSYEELLATKNDEISRMKKELGQAKAALAERTSESETIAILRAQVEVYQGDFRAEREAREALATDREKLRDELQQLQTRNTQLVDELETYQRRNFNQGRAGHGSRGASEERLGLSAAAAAAPSAQPLSADSLWEKLSISSDKKEEEKLEEQQLDENLFYCPKCNKSFTQYRPLEEHVNRCLDED